MKRRSSVRKFLGDARGNMATLTALSAPIVLMFAAFAVDEGALYLERREVQHIADLAAIAAAGNPANPSAAAMAVLASNGLAAIPAASPNGEENAGNARRELIEVKTGAYRPDPSVPAGQRFVAGASPTNAVRVRIVKRGTRHFGYAFTDDLWISAAGIASAQSEAAFSIGTRLARLDEGILNALLGGLTGSSISLSLMDYNALLDTDVSLLSFLDLLATRLSLTAGTYNQLLNVPVSIGQIAQALLQLDSLSVGAKAALGKLTGAGASRAVPLSALVSLGAAGALPRGASLPDEPRIGVFELLSALAYVGASDGKHQVSANIGAAIPGLLSARVTLAIGEPPQGASWFTLGPAGAVARTAQTRLLVDVDVGGPGGLLGTRIRLPVYVELANAEARLDRVSCPDGTPNSVRAVVAARPGVADIRIADPDTGALTNFSRAPAYSPATLVSVPLVRITGAAHASVSNQNWTTLQFSRAEIDGLAVKRVSTSGLVGSLTSSLLSNLSLDVQALGLGIGLPSGLTGTVAGLLRVATPAVDGLLDAVLTTLGVTVGEADVRVHAATCGRPVLVQ